jgi:Methyltransferase domain
MKTQTSGTPQSTEEKSGGDTKPPLVFRPTLERPTEEMIEFNRAAAEKLGVTPAIHPKDFIYWFCATHPLHTTESGINYYFQNAGLSARMVADLATTLGYSSKKRVKLLEFASGYGCVTRHLIKDPWFDVVSCDIHPPALEFLEKEIGVRSLASAAVPEQFTAPEKYDMVFALSFFTHMPKSSFGRWLKALFNVLEAPGYLAFTTHGYKSCLGLKVAPEEIPADGYWFRADSEQKDLDTAEYGLSLTTPDYVIGEIYRTLGAPIALYRHGYWWNEHDLWVVKREK